MWNDWHAEVRRSAAQCLGKTGHGRDVHDDLRARILEGSERIKLEAISKVGQLGIYIFGLYYCKSPEITDTLIFVWRATTVMQCTDH